MSLDLLFHNNITIYVQSMLDIISSVTGIVYEYAKRKKDFCMKSFCEQTIPRESFNTYDEAYFDNNLWFPY